MVIGMQVGLIILTLILAIGITVYNQTDGRSQSRIGIRPVGAFVGAVLFIGAIFLSMAVGQIDSGSIGVVTRFGAVTGRTIEAGFYFVTPLVESVEVMDLQTRKYQEPWSAGSKDLQEVNTTVAVNYKLDPSKVAEVYRSLRRDYLERVVIPAVGESIKATTANFDAEELLTKRPEIKAGIEASLRERLADVGIIVGAVSITNFEFRGSFQAAIEAKQVAAQRALESENQLVQIKIEALQAEASALGRRDAAVREAEGRRDSAILDAQGQSEAIRRIADAQAEANDLINGTLTDQIIQYSLVQELGEDIRVIVVPSGQQFILGEAIFGEAKQATSSP